MSSGGGGTTTNVTNNQPPQQFLDAYTALLGQANQVAATPLQQFNAGTNASNIVAPLNQNQNTAIGEIAGAQGVAQPYIDQGRQAFQSAQTPLWQNVQQFSPQNVGQYMSPYTQSVVQATQNQFNNQNAQQQQGIVSNAISKGAWGGDRAGIAQAELANQQQLAQAPVIAGLENQGYTQGLGEFNSQQQAQLGANEANAWLNSQAGFGLANLGGMAQNSQLAGASALLGAGGLQQQESQAQLNVPYEQFLQRQAYPFQTTQWLGNLTEGVGSNAGGTSTGSTTQPGTDQTGQIIGDIGALTLLAAAFNRGGQVRNRGGIVGGRYHRDVGGIIPSDIPDLSVSFIPQGKTPMGKGPPQVGAPSVRDAQKSSGAGGIGGTGLSISDLKGMKGSGTGLWNSLMDKTGWDGSMTDSEIADIANGSLLGASAGGLGALAGGSDIAAMAAPEMADLMFRRGGRLATGGGIVGYDDGGGIDNEYVDDMSDLDNSAPGHDVGQGLPQVPLQVADAVSSPAGPSGGGIVPDRYSVDYQPRKANPISDDDKRTNLLLAIASGFAGLGAGKSRNVAENVGQGIQQGLKTYTGLTQQDKVNAEKEAEQADTGNYRQSQLKQDALKLSDAASQAKTRLEQQAKRDQQLGNYQTGELANAAQRNKLEQDRLKQEDAFHRDQLNQGHYQIVPGVGDDGSGKQVPGSYMLNTKDGTTEFRPGIVQTGKGNAAPSDPDTVAYLGAQYRQTGKLPPLGMGGTELRQQVLSWAANDAKQNGVAPADDVAAQSYVRAGQAGLNKVVGYQQMVDSFADTANKNGQLALSLFDKGGGPTNTPVFNRWIQAGRQNLAGDADVTAFNTALTTFKNEYAKIMSGATGAQGSTDASRREADELFDKAANKQQFQRAFEVAQQEMQNRRQSLADQVKITQSGIRGSLPKAPAQSQSAAPASGASGSGFTEGQVIRQGANLFKVVNGQPVYQGPAP